MYRPEDIQKIHENIDKIKEDAQFEYRKTNEPTLKESSDVCKLVINFIKKKNRIVYGGYAQNLLIMNKNKDDVFYKSLQIFKVIITKKQIVLKRLTNKYHSSGVFLINSIIYSLLKNSF